MELEASSELSMVSFDLQDTSTHSKECSEALSRTIPGQLRLCGVVQSSSAESAEAVVRVVRVI